MQLHGTRGREVIVVEGPAPSPAARGRLLSARMLRCTAPSAGGRRVATVIFNFGNIFFPPLHFHFRFSGVRRVILSISKRNRIRTMVVVIVVMTILFHTVLRVFGVVGVVGVVDVIIQG